MFTDLVRSKLGAILSHVGVMLALVEYGCYVDTHEPIHVNDHTKSSDSDW
jgi:hypothetical protein